MSNETSELKEKLKYIKEKLKENNLKFQIAQELAPCLPLVMNYLYAIYLPFTKGVWQSSIDEDFVIIKIGKTSLCPFSTLLETLNKQPTALLKDFNDSAKFSRFYQIYRALDNMHGAIREEAEILFCIPYYYDADDENLELKVRKRIGLNIDQKWFQELRDKNNREKNIGETEWILSNYNVDTIRNMKTISALITLGKGNKI